MKNKVLTRADSIFCAQVASGKSQSEAYRIAFPRSRKWKDRSVHAEASRMMAKPMVSARVAELVAATEKETGMTREIWVEKWMAVERDSKSLFDRREALKEIGKAQGYYKPQKVELPEGLELPVRIIGLEERIRAVMVMSKKQLEIADAEDAEVVGSGVKQLEGGVS